MKLRVKKFLLSYSILLVGGALGFIFPAGVHAVVLPHTMTATAPAKDAQKPVSLLQENDHFTYQLQGRPDPFLPFISDKAQENPDEIVETHEKLTGMQLFEPGQLTLVALVHTSDEKFAMVQDVSGKGYIIKEGTKIGRRGVVTAIVPNKVVIEESSMTRSGRKLENTIVMVLRKEEKKK